VGFLPPCLIIIPPRNVVIHQVECVIDGVYRNVGSFPGRFRYKKWPGNEANRNAVVRHLSVRMEWWDFYLFLLLIFFLF
jgi:hypothetical protein